MEKHYWNKFTEDYDILIHCKNEEDMRTVMRQLKSVEKCQKIED